MNINDILKEIEYEAQKIKGMNKAWAYYSDNNKDQSKFLNRIDGINIVLEIIEKHKKILKERKNE